jgi:dipeptidase E
VSMSGGAPEVVKGIGLLPGSMSVHMHTEPERLPVYEAAVATGKLAPGYVADDSAGVVWHGTRMAECVVSEPDARVYRVESDGVGGVVKVPQPVRKLAGAIAGQPAHEPYGVSEMRALRGGRNRWD